MVITIYIYIQYIYFFVEHMTYKSYKYPRPARHSKAMKNVNYIGYPLVNPSHPLILDQGPWANDITIKIGVPCPIFYPFANLTKPLNMIMFKHIHIYI